MSLARSECGMWWYSGMHVHPHPHRHRWTHHAAPCHSWQDIVRDPAVDQGPAGRSARCPYLASPASRLADPTQPQTSTVMSRLRSFGPGLEPHVSTRAPDTHVATGRPPCTCLAKALTSARQLNGRPVPSPLCSPASHSADQTACMHVAAAIPCAGISLERT